MSTPICRKLFPEDPLDHEQIQHELKQHINKKLDEKLSKWSYDFKNDIDLGNRVMVIYQKDS
jgi:hypothetical protein